MSAAGAAQNAVNSAQSVLNATTDRQKKAEVAVTAAENALALAKVDAGVDFASTEAGKKAQVAVDAARAELDAAKEQQGDAQARFDAANTALVAAQDALKKLQASVGSVVSYEQNARGFFKWMGNETAVKLLTDAKYTGTDVNGHTFLSYTNLNDPEDATSLKNFKQALDYIDECNEIRKTRVGVQKLKVDLVLMALGEINANWSYRSVRGHASDLGEDPYYDYDDNGTPATKKINAAGENIAYGYSQPFKCWYDGEEANGGPHYKTIRDGSYKRTGFGYNSGTSVAAQEFGGTLSPEGATDSERHLYTTDVLRAKLNEFIELISKSGATTGDISNAQKAIDDAQAVVDAAKSALTTAIANVTTKQTAVANAQNAYDTAKQTYQSSAATKVATAQKDLDTANAAKAQADTDVTKAQTAVDTARTTLTAKNDELTQAKKAKQTADNTVTARQADVNAAKDKLASIKGGTDVADAQKAVDAAEKDLTDAKQKASEATDALTAAKDAATKAQSAYDAAVSKLADANAAAVKAKKSAADANARLQDAYGAYASLKQLADARDAAQRELDAANATYETAKQSLSDAQQVSKNAQANAAALVKRAAESAAAYDVMKGLTVDGILDGSVTMPADVVDKVLAIAKQRADAEVRVSETRKALDAAEEAYGTASVAYGKALDAYQAALEKANAAADAYKALATEIANRQQGDHGGHRDGGSGTNGGTGNDSGVSAARGRGYGHAGVSNGRYRHVGRVANGRAAVSMHGAKPRYVVLGEQPHMTQFSVASDAAVGNQEMPTNSADASEQGISASNGVEGTKSVGTKDGGNVTGSKPVGKHDGVTKSVSNAHKNDAGTSAALPIIGVAIVGGAVVATVYASKRKHKGDDDGSDTASK